MKTFHSGTDLGCLDDNVDKYDYYLSLIVNYEGKYDCKIAMLGKEKGGELYTKNNKRFNFNINNEQDVMYLIDCNIEFEPITFSNNKIFKNRVEGLKTVRNINTTRINQPVGFQQDRFNNPVKAYQNELPFKQHERWDSWNTDTYDKPVDTLHNRYKSLDDTQYDDFLVKWINHDLTSVGLLINAIDKQEKRYIEGGYYVEEKAEVYLDILEANFWDLAKQNFTETYFTTEEKAELLNRLMGLLDPFTQSFNFAQALYMIIEGFAFELEETEEVYEAK